MAVFKKQGVYWIDYVRHEASMEWGETPLGSIREPMSRWG